VQLRLSQGRAGQGRSLLARHSTGSVRGVQGRGTDMDWGESAPLLQEGDREQAGDTHWARQGPAVPKDSVVLTGGGRTVVRPVSRRTSQHCLPQSRRTSQHCLPQARRTSQLQLGAGQEEATGIIGAEEDETGISLCGGVLTTISFLLVILTLPFSLCVCFKVVQEYERAVIFRLGRLLSGGAKGPGIFFVLPCIESYQKVDLRTITLGVPPQEVLTKDSVTVSVDAVVYYKVSNATVSVANVENAHHSTRLLAQTTLRNILGTKNLHEILSDRDSISGSMQAALDEATGPWGIKVERVEIKDARLPVQLQRAMAAEAEAAREARAKVITAEGEQKASKSLAEASRVMAGSCAALQIRYLQTLSNISAEKNSTVIFPLPLDMVKNIME